MKMASRLIDLISKKKTCKKKTCENVFNKVAMKGSSLTGGSTLFGKVHTAHMKIFWHTFSSN